VCYRTQGGSNSGLRAWGIARVVEVPKPKKGAAAGEAKAVLQRFWRPEEVSRDVAYTAAFSEVPRSAASEPGASLLGIRPSVAHS
jgi:hypothetical protein